ncbi:MAG TPA: hemolysin family protein [Burkholderiales bacterium]|nr:hemolysin family protein [Burkholderiales bacterium]
MELVVLLALFLVNGVFAMSELAVVSSRRSRLQQLAENGHPGATAALGLIENPGRFLSTIQVGITLIGIFSGAFGEATLVAQLAPSLADLPLVGPYARETAIAIVVIGITYGSLILGELVPKRLALHAPEAIATRIALPMQLLSRLMHPFVKLLTISSEWVLRLFGVRETVKETITEAEIEGLMRAGAEAGVFERAEHQYVSRILHLDTQRVGAIMTPRIDMVYLDIDEPIARNLEIVRREGYTRLPVVRGDFAEVLGILEVLDLAEDAFDGKALDIRAHLRAPLYVPESVNLIRLLELLKQHKAHLALVLDEYGEVQGLVTMTDVLEAIVGAVPESEEAVEPDVVRRADGSLLVDGGVSIARLREALGREIETPPEEAGSYQTLGGLVMARLGRVPKVGDCFEFDRLRFEVLDMDRNRVDKVLLAELKQDGPEPGVIVDA